MKNATPFLLVLWASLAALPASAEETGDAQQGLTLARQVCSACHAIQPQQLRSPNPRSPTFSEIATTPGMTRTGLTIALTTPHAGMPMFRLTSEQRADIIAYFLSLQKSGPQPGK
ncbi:MAG: c-type cytochrome [Enhydrobacter sp.]|nr:c-type cytochrome [Enhydrobacter sp.]